MEVCLVSMPHTPVERPSLAVGLLQAVLERDGISTGAIYANILWCEKTGLHLYNFARHGENQFGDWIFSEVAFPEFKPDPQAYLRLIFSEPVLRRLRITKGELPQFVADVRGRARHFIDEIAGQIVDASPSIVGCSSTYAAHVSSLALLRRIRELAPHIVTMMGGANCESVMGLTTHEHFPWVDYVVSGEADGIIADLVKAIRHDGRHVGLAELPRGVFAPIHRIRGYAAIRGNPPRAVTEPLANMPTPNYDDYFEALNNAPMLGQIVHPGMPVEGSRGCWWGAKRQCVFCGLNGASMKFRHRPPEEVLNDLNSLRERYGVNQFGFTDNILNPQWFMSLFPRLRELEAPFSIACETSPALTKRQISIMTDAGVNWLQPGMESLHPGTLALLNKGTKAWLNVRFLKWCLYYGIYVYWFLLDDVPGQDDEWYSETQKLIPALYHLSPPRLFNSVLFARHSMYHTDPDRYGLRLTPSPGYSVTYPLSEERLKTIAYLFINERPGMEDQKNEIREIRRKALLDVLVEWTRLFHSNDRPVLQVSDTGTELHVRDTRPATAEQSFRLSASERTIYLACEDGIRPETLHRQLSAEGRSKSEIEDATISLRDRRLLVYLDNHLLSLGTPEPLRAVPQTIRHSCGHIDEALYDALLYLREGSNQPF